MSYTPLDYYWIQISNAKGIITIKDIKSRYKSAINICFKGDALYFEVNENDANSVDLHFNNYKLTIFALQDMIQEWHELPRTVNISIYKFLNCTPKAYKRWIENE